MKNEQKQDKEMNKNKQTNNKQNGFTQRLLWLSFHFVELKQLMKTS